MSGPLTGRTVLVTRPAHQAEDLVAPLTALGAAVHSLPAIAIAPPDDFAPLDRALVELPSFDWLVLTSVNGVEAVHARVVALGIEGETFERVRLAAIGSSTAAAMGRRFRAPDFVPPEYVSEAIAEGLGDVAGRRFLLARADRARKELPTMLRERGADVTDVVAYRVVSPESPPNLPDRAPTDITLTSSASARSLWEMLRRANREEWMRTARLVCIGPITAATVRELGFEVAAVAETATIPGVVAALQQETYHA